MNQQAASSSPEFAASPVTGSAPPARSRWVAKLVAASLLFLAPLLLLPYVSATRPITWQPLGLRGETVLALNVVSSEGERIIYAETHTGLWRYSPSAGWQRIDGPLPRTPLGGPALAAWRVVPGRPRQLYALTGSGTSRQLYRSDNSGDTWQIIGPAPGQTTRPPMLVLPGLSGAPDTVTLVTGSRVQRSTDGGATWTPGGPWPNTSPTPPPPGASQPADEKPSPATLQARPTIRTLLSESSVPDYLYALTGDGELWISDSGGLAWHVVESEAVARPANALASAPYFGVRIWVATADRMAYSSDNGDTWATQPLPPIFHKPGGGQIRALLIDPRVPDTVYAALVGGAVYRSDDSGVSWRALGAPGATKITALALDPDTRGQLYVATEDGIWTRSVVPISPRVLNETEGPVSIETGTMQPSATVFPTMTASPHPTRTGPPTMSPTRTPSATPSASATFTSTPSRTPAPTFTPTASPTVPPPTLTPAPPPAPPTRASTAVPPSASPTVTAPTATPFATPEPR